MRFNVGNDLGMESLSQMDLSIGTMVEVRIKRPGEEEKKTCYGIVRWFGFHPGIPQKLVGLELVSDKQNY